MILGSTTALAPDESGQEKIESPVKVFMSDWGQRSTVDIAGIPVGIAKEDMQWNRQ